MFLFFITLMVHESDAICMEYNIKTNTIIQMDERQYYYQYNFNMTPVDILFRAFNVSVIRWIVKIDFYC